MIVMENNLPTVWPVTCHTDHIGKGSIFVAIKGQKNDGVYFIEQALVLGAKKIIVARDAHIPSELAQAIAAREVSLVFVDDTRQSLAQLSAHAHGFPARKLKIIAVTGTKGKTTTACFMHHVLRTSGYAAALMSSVYNKINDHCYPASLTTPQPDYMHMFFAQCVAQGIEYVVMEVAAQATSLHRTDGLIFDAAVFTNFGHEHSEFYTSFDDYFEAKVHALKQVKIGGPIVLNADDTRVAALKNTFKHVSLFGFSHNVDFTMQLDESYERLSGCISHGDEKKLFECRALFGVFNGYNILAVAAATYALGISLAHVVDACLSMYALPGRLEQHPLKNGAVCIIDCAHTPDSYEQLLSLLRKKTDHLSVVFGAGGSRDKTKRPIMGGIAARYADIVFLTSDNPRAEDPQQIACDIAAGITLIDQKNKVVIELDREKAITMAYQFTQKGGIIALLGKGPDEYQLINDVKVPFSEKEIIRRLDI